MAKTAKTAPVPNQKLRFERERRAWSQQQLADEIGTTPLNIGRWERGITQPGPHFRHKLLTLFNMTAEQLDLVTEKGEAQAPEGDAHSSIAMPENKTAETSLLWNVPYRRNPFFTGRADVLSQLYETLTTTTQTVALVQPQALSGLGGIGKTQTAIEYAYRYRDSYNNVLWGRADSSDLLISDFLIFAALLELPERNEQEQSKIVNAVLRWFDTHEGWLLILDNADDLDRVSEFVPTAGKGHVLLTTRAQATGTIAQRIEIEKMGIEESMLFLLHRIKRLRGDAPLETVNEQVRQQIQAIVELLDGLPLALDQAGAYIEETGCSLSDYLRFYKTRRNRLLRARGRDATGHPEPVATTWSLSFGKIEHTNSAAAELLKLSAFLHPDGIPESMLVEGASELGPSLGSIAQDELDLNEAIGELYKYSLMKRDVEKKILTIHRLVQAVVRDEMNEEEKKKWVNYTIKMLNRIFPDVEFATWNKCQLYLPHTVVCINTAKHLTIENDELACLAYRTAEYVVARGQYLEAEALHTRALELRRKLLNPVHIDIADSLQALGMIYWRRGNYQAVEQYLLQSLQIVEQVFGYAHAKTASVYNDLAVLYDNQSKYEQAETFYKRSLAIYEQISDPNLEDMATTICNLALFYSRHGKYSQSEQLHQRALEMRQRHFGPQHPEVATSIHQMGILYFNQGKYTETEQFWQRALTLREQTLGTLHPDVAFTLNNLGVLYNNQGRYKEAEDMHSRALTIREQMLGPFHPEVAHSLGNVAALYREQKRFEEAEKLQQRALSIREKVHGGLKHVDLGFSFSNLGWLKYDQGMYAEAEVFFERALAIREQLLGFEHKETAYTLIGMGVLYRDQGKYELSETSFKRAIDIQERLELLDHPERGEALDGLAHLYLNMARYEEAEPLFVQALTIRDKSLRAGHPLIAATLDKYAALLHKTNRSEEARALEARALAIRAK